MPQWITLKPPSGSFPHPSFPDKQKNKSLRSSLRSFYLRRSGIQAKIAKAVFQFVDVGRKLLAVEGVHVQGQSRDCIPLFSIAHDYAQVVIAGR